MAERPSTPPSTRAPAPTDLTPEQVRRMEESRLRAKALRTQQDATTSTTQTAGQKRPYSATLSTATVAPTHRDARNPSNPANGTTAGPARPHDDITAARKFTKYVEYDFSKMTDTKGGFLTADDDPHNKALHAQDPADAKPAHMTAKEWERHQLLKKLRERRAGPFEPGLSVLKAEDERAAGCAECGTLEIDWRWLDVFGVRVCAACKERLPDKYSLLTKTEVREDYLLTEPELRDRELLPALERPNPHKATWNSMLLFLRCQVEEYAFGERKWGSAERLDEEFEKREGEKKRRKDKKWQGKLDELKKRTRTEVYRRGKGVGIAAAGNHEGERNGAAAVPQFGDKIARRMGERHEHEWGRTLVNEEGIGVKRCVECGMEVEELEF